MRRIDLEAADTTVCGKRDDGMIVAGAAATPRLPAVHPLAVLVIDTGMIDRRRVLKHALERREELVGCEDRPRAESRGGEVDRV
ncbi:hypothetical protein D9M70_532710 [compost metagenome]